MNKDERQRPLCSSVQILPLITKSLFRMRPLRSCLLWLLCILSSGLALGQDYYGKGLPQAIDTVGQAAGDLSLNLAVESFFRNDEYNYDIQKDYTLPGYRLSTDLCYRLATERPVFLRLGVDNIYFWGASLYPGAIAYTDLPYWSDAEKQTRFRLRPRVQAAIALGPTFTAILGSIQGGARHRLISPLYNPELHLSADSETGLQLLFQNERFNVDTWLNWQSFIFKTAKHQEAFTAGLNATYLLNENGTHQTGLNLQLLAVHRGGVQNTLVPDTVHTWLNTAFGFTYSQRVSYKLFKDLRLRHRAYLLSYLQRGEHYPPNAGMGIYLDSQVEDKHLAVHLAAFLAKNYVAPLGSPFSRVIDDEDFSYYNQQHLATFLRSGIRYQLIQKRQYVFGTALNLWFTPLFPSHPLSYYYGVYLSISPSFLLTRF